MAVLKHVTRYLIGKRPGNTRHHSRNRQIRMNRCFAAGVLFAVGQAAQAQAVVSWAVPEVTDVETFLYPPNTAQIEWGGLGLPDLDPAWKRGDTFVLFIGEDCYQAGCLQKFGTVVREIADYVPVSIKIYHREEEVFHPEPPPTAADALKTVQGWGKHVHIIIQRDFNPDNPTFTTRATHQRNGEVVAVLLPSGTAAHQ